MHQGALLPKELRTETDPKREAEIAQCRALAALGPSWGVVKELLSERLAGYRAELEQPGIPVAYADYLRGQIAVAKDFIELPQEALSRLEAYESRNEAQDTQAEGLLA